MLLEGDASYEKQIMQDLLEYAKALLIEKARILHEEDVEECGRWCSHGEATHIE